MPEWFATPAQRYRAILVAGLLVLIGWILLAARAALLPFILGALLAYLFVPVVDLMDRVMPRFLRRIGWSRVLAILIVYVAVIAVVAGALAYFVPAVIAQAETFSRTVPSYLVRLRSSLEHDIVALLENIPQEVRDAVNANLGKAGETVLAAIQKGVAVTLSTVSQTVSFVLGMVIVPIWLFYVLNDQARIRATLLDLVPPRAREDVRSIIGIIDRLLSAYIRGQLLLCLIVGLMSLIALIILRVNLALLLATFAGIFEVIPILGPYLGAIPAVLVAFLTRPILALWVALAFAAIQQIENVFLVPRIAGNAVRFHPALAMIIIVVGSEIAGLWGILLALPVAAMVRDVFRYLYLRTTERGATPQMALEAMHAAAHRPFPS